jgi:hypothetical protein
MAMNVGRSVAIALKDGGLTEFVGNSRLVIASAAIFSLHAQSAGDCIVTAFLAMTGNRVPRNNEINRVKLVQLMGVYPGAMQ